MLLVSGFDGAPSLRLSTTQTVGGRTTSISHNSTGHNLSLWPVRDMNRREDTGVDHSIRKLDTMSSKVGKNSSKRSAATLKINSILLSPSK